MPSIHIPVSEYPCPVLATTDFLYPNTYTCNFKPVLTPSVGDLHAQYHRPVAYYMSVHMVSLVLKITVPPDISVSAQDVGVGIFHAYPRWPPTGKECHLGMQIENPNP